MFPVTRNETFDDLGENDHSCFISLLLCSRALGNVEYFFDEPAMFQLSFSFFFKISLRVICTPINLISQRWKETLPLRFISRNEIDDTIHKKKERKHEDRGRSNRPRSHDTASINFPLLGNSLSRSITRCRCPFNAIV